MPFKKRGASALAYTRGKKKQKLVTNPANVLPSNSTTDGIQDQKNAKALVSPVADKKQSRKSAVMTPVDGTLGIQELLQVFLELEQLEEKLLRPAVVHGRKKLQALADTGSTVTEVVDIITIEDELIEEREDEAEEGDTTGGATAAIMYTRRTKPDSSQLIELNPSCFDFNRFQQRVSYSAARKRKSRAMGKIIDAIQNPLCTKEQQVFALREAMLHPNLKCWSSS